MVVLIEIIFWVLHSSKHWRLNVYCFWVWNDINYIISYQNSFALNNFLVFSFHIISNWSKIQIIIPYIPLKSSLKFHFSAFKFNCIHPRSHATRLHTHSPIICYANSFLFSLSRQFILFVVYLQHQMCFKIYDNHITCGFCMCEETKKIVH